MPTAPPRLIAGPYAAPRFKIGRELAGLVACRTCLPDGPSLVEGPHKVVGILDGPIAWPYTVVAGTRPQLIITAELERAIRTESVLAVAHWWGVSRWWVERARHALGVARMNPGTQALWRELASQRLGLPGRRKGGGYHLKLSPAKRAKLIQRRLKGERAAALAAEYGVSRQYVGALVKRSLADASG